MFIFAVHLPKHDDHEKIHGYLEKGGKRVVSVAFRSHGKGGMQEPPHSHRNIWDKAHPEGGRTGRMAGSFHIEGTGNKK